jgi:acyl carrier protein
MQIQEEKRMDSVFEQIKEIVVNQLGVDPDQVTIDARFREDLKADSLDLVEMVMAFEEKFGGQIPDEDAQKILKVSDAVSYIQSRKK